MEIPLYDENLVENQSDDESVDEIQIAQNQAENHENEVPYVGQPQIVYDIEEDDDLQITFSSITPRPKSQQITKRGQKELKKKECNNNTMRE